MARRRGPRKIGPKSERVPAWPGWIGLALYVAAWDLHPWTRTLSSGFAPANGDQPQGGKGAPHGRLTTNFIGLYILAHLMRVLPVKWDILRNPNSPLVRLQRMVVHSA